MKAVVLQRLQDALPSWQLRVIEDCCPVLRSWHAAFRPPRLHFGPRLLGMAVSKHIVFSDDEAASSDGAAADDPVAAQPQQQREPRRCIVAVEVDNYADSAEEVDAAASSSGSEGACDAEGDMKVDWAESANWSEADAILAELNSSQRRAVTNFLARTVFSSCDETELKQSPCVC
eukprot:TRINITY_DN8704_c0_g2_i5.p1 TRINITY_DN8704_c0_g2~~TRINITY_DN8704_c0_g2_i5.p1  ORF type:complete len:175 (+),score=43.60 TRINITY_DN8704_c0_g2_i5:366-890(+)